MCGGLRRKGAAVAAIKREHSEESEGEEGAKEERMDQIAIGQKMRAGPERERPEERLPGEARDAGGLGGEARALAFEGERIRGGDAEGCEKADGGHGEVDDPAMPERVIPEGHLRRAASSNDEPP